MKHPGVVPKCGSCEAQKLSQNHIFLKLGGGSGNGGLELIINDKGLTTRIQIQEFWLAATFSIVNHMLPHFDCNTSFCFVFLDLFLSGSCVVVFQWAAL